MMAMFYVYDTVDREVVQASAEFPGSPRSVYRPVYWAGNKAWWLYTAVAEGEGPNGAAIHVRDVPEVVRLYHMVIE